MTLRLPIRLFVVAILVGCEPRGFYPLTVEKIMVRQESLPGEIYLVQGSRFGVFKEGPESVGNIGVAGSLQVETKYGSQTAVTWPAAPGYNFEASSYINELDECLYVVRKVKAQ